MTTSSTSSLSSTRSSTVPSSSTRYPMAPPRVPSSIYDTNDGHTQPNSYYYYDQPNQYNNNNNTTTTTIIGSNNNFTMNNNNNNSQDHQTMMSNTTVAPTTTTPAATDHQIPRNEEMILWFGFFTLFLMSFCVLWYIGGGRIRIDRDENGRIRRIRTEVVDDDDDDNYVDQRRRRRRPRHQEEQHGPRNNNNDDDNDIRRHRHGHNDTLTKQQVLDLPEIIFYGVDDGFCGDRLDCWNDTVDLEAGPSVPVSQPSYSSYTTKGKGHDIDDDDQATAATISHDEEEGISVVVEQEDCPPSLSSSSSSPTPMPRHTNNKVLLSQAVSSLCRYTTCPICIDDFTEGEHVRILPICGHMFHTECLVPWLTKKHGVCPACKQCVYFDINNYGDDDDNHNPNRQQQQQQQRSSSSSSSHVPPRSFALLQEHCDALQRRQDALDQEQRRHDDRIRQILHRQRQEENIHTVTVITDANSPMDTTDPNNDTLDNNDDNSNNNDNNRPRPTGVVVVEEDESTAPVAAVVVEDDRHHHDGDDSDGIEEDERMIIDRSRVIPNLSGHVRR